MADTKPTALYRAYSATDELLYVGISISVMSRLSDHKSSSDWFAGASRVDIEWHPTRREALAAEMQAIKTERPIYNKMGRVAESADQVVRDKGITAGSLRELGWYIKLWCRLVGRWEDKAKAEPSIVISLAHWKRAHQNAEKVETLWHRRKRRKDPICWGVS